MTYQRLAYDDAATTSEMLTDAAAAERELSRELPLPSHDEASERHPLDAAAYESPVVSDDLAELAAGLELHFD